MKDNKKKKDSIKVSLTPIPNELVVRVVTWWREEDFAELKNRIFRNCRKYFLYEDAQEVTQKILLGIAEQKDKLESIVHLFNAGKKEESPGGYVTQIIRNQIINIWRAKGRRRKVFQTGISTDEIADKVAAAPTPDNYPEAKANSEEFKEILRDIRAKAAPMQRNWIDAFLYQQWYGMSIAQIADVMSTPERLVKEGTVKAWIFRGRRYLQQEFLKRGYSR
jgi:RNA polymerase sigma factor (sigma-70 family)